MHHKILVRVTAHYTGLQLNNDTCVVAELMSNSKQVDVVLLPKTRCHAALPELNYCCMNMKVAYIAL